MATCFLIINLFGFIPCKSSLSVYSARFCQFISSVCFTNFPMDKNIEEMISNFVLEMRRRGGGDFTRRITENIIENVTVEMWYKICFILFGYQGLQLKLIAIK